MLYMKKPGKFRICIEPRDLNKGIKQLHYIMPISEDILPNLADASQSILSFLMQENAFGTNS